MHFPVTRVGPSAVSLLANRTLIHLRILRNFLHDSIAKAFRITVEMIVVDKESPSATDDEKSSGAHGAGSPCYGGLEKRVGDGEMEVKER